MSDRLVHRGRRIFHFAPVLIALGCNAILGIDSGHPKDREGGDAAPDVSIIEADTGPAPKTDAASDANSSITDAPLDVSASDGDGSTVCTSRVPPRPTVDDNPTGAAPELVLALETLQVKDEPGKELGFDLDGRCTCPDVSACLLNGTPLDKTCALAPGGRDIVGNFLLGQFAAKETAFSQDALQMRLAKGAAGAILKITDYNGAANDPAVTLEFFGEAWMPLDDAGVQPTPRKDGTDTWTVYPDTVGFISAGPQAIQRDTVAYVTNHTLVAHLLDATIALRPDTGVNDNPLVIEVHDAFMTAKLVSTDRGFRLESAMLGGRWPSDRILKSFATLADVNGSICKNSGSYLLLKVGVCATQDIASKQADDNHQAPCNAVSWGFGFTAGPAHIDPIPKSPTFVQNDCGDDWAPTCD